MHSYSTSTSAGTVSPYAALHMQAESSVVIRAEFCLATRSTTTKEHARPRTRGTQRPRRQAGVLMHVAAK
jgi:hypothetical protein